MAVEEHLKVVCSSYSKTNIQILYITQMHADISMPTLTFLIHIPMFTNTTFTLKQAKLHMNPVIQTTQFQF